MNIIPERTATAAVADDFCGNVLCLMAISNVCTCRCEGEWHGAGRRAAASRNAA